MSGVRRKTRRPPGREAVGLTPEAEDQKRRLVGARDFRLAENQLGVAYARGLIRWREMHAGHEYAQLWARKWGRPLPQASGLFRMVGGGMVSAAVSEGEWLDREDRAAVAFDSADGALRSAGREARRAVQLVAVGVGRGAVDWGALAVGLRALADHWRMERDDRAAE